MSILDKLENPPESLNGPVRVSYFDLATGEPCDGKPEPLRREMKRTSVEERNAAQRERERGEREAREISDAMRRRTGLKPDGTRRQGKRAVGRDGAWKRPVVVDGRLFPSVTAAAEEVGTTPQHLGTRLRRGPCKVKGRAVAFAEDRA